MKLAVPGISGLTASQSRPASISTNAAVPGRSAALDVCVASSIAAAARGDAAQAAFNRKLSHYRNEIVVLLSGRRTHGGPPGSVIQCSPAVWGLCPFLLAVCPRCSWQFGALYFGILFSVKFSSLTFCDSEPVISSSLGPCVSWFLISVASMSTGYLVFA